MREMQGIADFTARYADAVRPGAGASVREQYARAMRGSQDFAKSHRGKPAIVANVPAPKLMTHAYRARGVELPRLSGGEQHKMLEAVVKGHELAETQVRPGSSVRGFGHRHPDVLLREHNMLVTLPEKYAPVKEYLTAARATADAPTLEYLSDGAFQYGKGQRFSRHARKRLGEMMEAKSLREREKELSTLKARQAAGAGIREG